MSEMFGRLKDKFWGKELLAVRIDSLGKSSVCIWEKDGKRSLGIKSEKFSYIQSPGRNDGTVWFELSEIVDLLDAVKTAVEMNEANSKAGGQA
ncbi:MAG: hypothetical protein ACRCWO_03660 [Bosea sp. (in: a-proteobacteria)]